MSPTSMAKAAFASKATEANNIKFAYKDKNKMTPANTIPGLTAYSEDNTSFDYMNDVTPFQDGETEGDVNDMNMGGRVPFNTQTNGDLSNPKKQMP